MQALAGDMLIEEARFVAQDELIKKNKVLCFFGLKGSLIGGLRNTMHVGNKRLDWKVFFFLWVWCVFLMLVLACRFAALIFLHKTSRHTSLLKRFPT